MSELVYGNMKLWDGRSPAPRPMTIGVRRGRVVEVGEGTPKGAFVDLAGAVVTPGLVDAHLHLLLGGESRCGVDLSQVACREEFEAVMEAADAALAPGRWLLASGWNETNWADSTLPDVGWLRCVGDRPVVCWRCDWHAALVNDVLVRMLDLTADPRGGRIVRDWSGAPTGLLVEAAAWDLVNPIIPPLPNHERAAALDGAMRHLLASGVTMARTMEYRADVERFYVPRMDSLPMRLSVVQLDRTLPLDLAWLDEVPSAGRLHVRGCKAFLDGTLGSRTARLHDPYTDDPATRGLWVELALEGQDGAWLDQVLEAGLSPVMHAIGDAALSRALRLQQRCPERCTIEHAELAGPAELAAMDGARLSVQPTHRAQDAGMAQVRLGDRASSLLPLRSMQQAGATLAFGTDWPISPVDPVATLRAAITGEDVHGRPFQPEQAMSPHDAFLAATVHAAEVCGYERPLSDGAPCDLVIWRGDPFADIRTAAVQATVVDGTLVAGTWPTEDRKQRGADR